MTEDNNSPFVQGILNRFGGLVQRQPFETPDGRKSFLDETKQGVIVLHYIRGDIASGNIGYAEIIHGTDLETAINEVLRVVSKPQKEQHVKFGVVLNPDESFDTEFSIKEFGRLLDSLVEKGCEYSYCTICTERWIGEPGEQIDIFSFLNTADKEILTSTTVTALRGKGMKLAVNNMYNQLSPVLSML